jgi:hypothetical protein
MALAEPVESMEHDHAGKVMPVVGGGGMGHERRHDPEMALASVLFEGWVAQRESVRMERGIPSLIVLSALVMGLLGLSICDRAVGVGGASDLLADVHPWCGESVVGRDHAGSSSIQSGIRALRGVPISDRGSRGG